MSGLSSPRRERNQMEKLKLGPQDWMGMTFRNFMGKRCWLSWCLGKGLHLKLFFLFSTESHLTEKVSVTLSFLSPLSSRSSMLSSSIPPNTWEDHEHVPFKVCHLPGSAWDCTHGSFHIFRTRDWLQLLVSPVWGVKHIEGMYKCILSRVQIVT